MTALWVIVLIDSLTLLWMISRDREFINNSRRNTQINNSHYLLAELQAKRLLNSEEAYQKGFEAGKRELK